MYRIQILFTFIILLTFVGCSSDKSPVTPDPSPQQTPQLSENLSNRSIWGYWTVKIDPDTSSVEIIPDRDLTSHFNVVRLLEVTPCTDCLKINNLSFLPDNTLQCDFELTHPFPGLIKFTGFDVRGVLVTNGDTIFPESNRLASIDGSNPILLNPDGYTSLFNPVEFPEDSAPFPILGYIPGKFSSGDNFTATLNPFMAFCKENPRRMFSAGATETVTINLKYPSTPIEFGYIVDASWVLVDEVIDPVTDFPPEANCLEPYRLDFRMPTVLSDEPGDTAQVQVEIFDHQGIDTISTVSIECPSLFDGEIFLNYSSQSTNDSWLYEGEITNQYGLDTGCYPALIKTDSTDSDLNLGELMAYQISDIHVFGDGHLIWAKRAGGSDLDGGVGITALSDNSTVLTGIFFDSATFGEGEFAETVLVSDGDYDIFVARYNSDGTLAWAKQAGGTACEVGSGITALSENSIVLTGMFNESATFGKDEFAETVLVSNGEQDIFVAQYNPDGSLAWAKRAGGSAREYGFGITTLSDNSTVLTGYFEASATFGEGETNETILVSCGAGLDIFVARYNPDGSLAWAKRAGGAGESDQGIEVTTLADDSTVVTGFFTHSAIFGEGETNMTFLDAEAQVSIFVARYNPNGTLAWAKMAGGIGPVYSFGITSLSDNSTAVIGTFSGTVEFGEGEPNETVLESDGIFNIFIAGYNPDGTLAWAKNVGGTGLYFDLGITSLSDDSLMITGHFRDIATFGEGDPSETVLVSVGEHDIFVARYNPDGTLAWAKRAGGSGRDYGCGISALSDDSLVVTGRFTYSSSFGLNEPNETILVSAGSFDIFIARFAP